MWECFQTEEEEEEEEEGVTGMALESCRKLAISSTATSTLVSLLKLMWAHQNKMFLFYFFLCTINEGISFH